MMHRGILVCAVIVAGCDQYKEPPAPRDVHPVTTRSAELATSGIDMAGTGEGRTQRSGMSGTNSDTNDQQGGETPDIDVEGAARVTSVFGSVAPAPDAPVGRGSTDPQSDLDTPEMRNAQRGGRVFRPSDHYYVNGEDLGPSWDAAPGSGGPQKLKQTQP